MNIHGWKFVKKKMDCSKRPSEKKKGKIGLEQKQKKKVMRKKNKKEKK